MIIDYINQFNNLTLGYPRVKNKKLNTLEDMHGALNTIYAKRFLKTHEFLYAILLGQEDVVLKVSKISSVKGRILDIDIVKLFELLEEIKPSGLIVSHNHPSGTLEPSEDDLTFTVSLYNVCWKFNTELKDHLIYTDKGMYSMFQDLKI